MKPSEVKSADDVRRMVAETEAEFVTVGMVDTQGMLRGKYLSRRKFLSALDHGLGIPAVTLGLDYNDVIAENAKISDAGQGCCDAILRVIPDSCRVIPWEPARRNLFFQIEYGDETAALCLRLVFKRIMARADAMDLVPYHGVEYEFTLFNETPTSVVEKGFRNLNVTTPYKTYYVLQRQSVWSEFYNAIMDACQALEIPLDTMHEEMGPGFMEATIAYGPGVRVCDDAAIFKSYAKAVAQRRDLMMTFMARWSNGADGHSGHVHLSLRDKQDKPLFHDASAPHGMSKTMRHFVGGMQALMPELLLMLAPNVNSFKRLVPGIFAPIAAVWGIENRSCAIRVIPGEPKSQRIECRSPGADANPYFSVGALVAAGLWGIERELEPGPPMMESAYTAKIPPGTSSRRPSGRRSSDSGRRARRGSCSGTPSSTTMPTPASGRNGSSAASSPTGSWSGSSSWDRRFAVAPIVRRVFPRRFTTNKTGSVSCHIEKFLTICVTAGPIVGPWPRPWRLSGSPPPSHPSRHGPKAARCRFISPGAATRSPNCIRRSSPSTASKSTSQILRMLPKRSRRFVRDIGPT